MNNKNEVLLLDLEVFPQFFEMGIKNFKTKETINYEVSEWTDNRLEIFNFLSQFNGYLVTFNGLSYDCMILKYLITNRYSLEKMSKNKFLYHMKKFNDMVINDELNWDKIKKYKWQKVNWTDIDLYCYWSKMLRLSKKISLKSLAIQLDYPVVMELPYDPSTVLTKEQIKEVRHYNNVHDLGILDLLMQKMLPEVKLRSSIKKDYGLDCLSWDAIKITSESLLQEYCKETNKEIDDVRKWKWEKPIIYIKDILSDFNPYFQLPVFQNLYERILNSIDGFNEELIINEGKTSLLLSYGVGGLHSLQENQMFDSNEEYMIVDSDFASLYPNIIINWNCIRFPEVFNIYKDIKIKRMEAKKAKRKTEDSFLKLQLNG